MNLKNRLTNLVKRREGQTLLEYALILCLIVFVLLVVGYAFRETWIAIYWHIYTVIRAWCGCF
ncbi:MAG TPA: hypothetical protein VD902_11020 [Symbiobacteriaceae bacterium]|nr:hypothetical protein [Symbiobacteriaceae bacterium]